MLAQHRYDQRFRPSARIQCSNVQVCCGFLLSHAPDRGGAYSWAIAQSPILNTTITLSRLAKRGYEALLDHYRKVAPHLNEPLYTRPVRTVV
jgi:hypothetical protein